MSVYIKGFPLPNNCGACPLRLAWCRERIYMVTRPERCPLVPVPEHGRLIDADAFERLECNGCDGACEALPCDCTNCDAECRCDFMLDIHAAPTIIPADKEGEG